MAVPPWNTRVQVAAALSDAVRSYQSREAATYHRGLYTCDWSLSLFRVRPGPLQPLLETPSTTSLEWDGLGECLTRSKRLPSIADIAESCHLSLIAPARAVPISKLVRLDEALAERIDEFRFRERFKTEADAI